MVESERVGAIRLTEPVLDGAELDAVRKVLDSGWLAEGEVTRRFERKVADYVGAKYAVATCNCTVALELCLKAYDIKGEVIVPDFTHPATAQAVINAGATPILVDVDIDEYNVDLNKTSKVVTRKTDAIIPVSWAGNPLDYVNKGPSHRREIPCIEDAACSLGASLYGYRTGRWVTACFSFHPRKLVTCGEGGMVATWSYELADKVQSLKTFGDAGGNYKLSDIQSAIGLVQMEKIEAIIERRIEMATVYNDLLSEVPNVKPPWKHPSARHTYQTYAVYLEKGDRNKIIVKLATKGIETQVGAYALHLLPQFKDAKRVGFLRNSEKLHRNLLALPMSYSMTDEDQKRVVSELKTLVN